MNHTKQPENNNPDTATDFGMGSDDVSMLNQVLQQVKGISGVSYTSYDVADQPSVE